ncbi:hypothetical protein BIW11_11173 [Tropilaelaps mercedesae]|uniref:Uncharacterized protein n=1 Tax=Tropilaelaps mercedesae TaxID=418985 RepID=A0A1V9XC78_9ACAR|nr:hypothetical protein BIW11_11173 [Tropilaelaps mercedesae]
MATPRYGFVSFGHSENVDEPFTRTANGQILFPAKDVPLALRGMNFTSTHKADTFLALRKALVEYRFRPNAAKIIIAFTCHACDVIDETAPDSADLQRALIESGATLHLVSKTDIRLRSSSSKRLDLLGIDRSTAFTLRDASRRDSVGQPELRRQLRSPKDRCASLAQKSRGSYFMTPRRPEVRAWRTVLAKRVAQDVSLETRCMRCECAPVENWSTVTVCRPCRPYRDTGLVLDDDYEDID